VTSAGRRANMFFRENLGGSASSVVDTASVAAVGLTVTSVRARSCFTGRGRNTVGLLRPVLALDRMEGVGDGGDVFADICSVLALDWGELVLDLTLLLNFDREKNGLRLKVEAVLAVATGALVVAVAVLAIAAGALVVAVAVLVIATGALELAVTVLAVTTGVLAVTAIVLAVAKGVLPTVLAVTAEVVAIDSVTGSETVEAAVVTVGRTEGS